MLSVVSKCAEAESEGERGREGEDIASSPSEKVAIVPDDRGRGGGGGEGAGRRRRRRDVRARVRDKQSQSSHAKLARDLLPAPLISNFRLLSLLSKTLRSPPTMSSTDGGKGTPLASKNAQSAPGIDPSLFGQPEYIPHMESRRKRARRPDQTIVMASEATFELGSIYHVNQQVPRRTTKRESMATTGIAQAHERLGLLPVAVPALDNTAGALLIGTFLGLILFGVTLHQGYRYTRFPAYERDSVYIKYTVAVVLVLETLHSALALHVCYYYLVTNYFNPLALLKRGPWSANTLPALTGLIVAVTQGFFSRRLFLLNRGYLVVIIFVLILLLGELGFSISCTVEAFRQPDIFDVQKFQWLSISALALIIGADGLLTTLLTVVLCRSRTGFKSTDSILNLLIFYTINNGLLTGTLTIVSLFMAIFYPHSLITDGINICIAKAYANTLLSVLNHRHFLRNYGKATTETSGATDVRPAIGYHDTGEDFHRVQATSNSQRIMHIKITQDIVRDASIHSADDDMYVPADDKEPNYVNAASTVV
ncbi:hypothetical protein C2E23DRAFT_439283 [Lenzites betulinus]|nr:hypothetical protein C2E23DRAFT_439283 [Lenzites betulinus]